MRMQEAKDALAELVRDLRGRYPDYGIEYEVFVTAPGAEIDEGHPMIAAIDAGHERVFGQPPERDIVRWFSDASRADALRDRDGQLRNLERAPRARRREFGHRRSGQSGDRLRIGGRTHL